MNNQKACGFLEQGHFTIYSNIANNDLIVTIKFGIGLFKLDPIIHRARNNIVS